NVGIKDNFFQLGGDSIKAIRAISKLREYGYELTIKELIQGMTIEMISEKTKVLKVSNEVIQDEVNGEVLYSPIQKDFFNWNFKNYNHFNQSFMVKTKSFNEIALRKALKQIVVHHDILRAVYRDGKQEILPTKNSKLYDLEIFDYKNLDDCQLIEKVNEESNKIQKSIDIKTGPMVKAALFKCKNEDNLLICIHHLVVDGVSWRILLEDLEIAYKQALDGKDIRLPNKTASYKEWTQTLEEYKYSKELLKEVKYWNSVNVEINEGNIKYDLNFADEYKHFSVEIDKDTTRQLLYESNKTYNTEINDLILSALVIAVNKSTNQNKLAIKLEGHGREELHKPLVIDRTVGWFTSIYPVVLKNEDTIVNTIIGVKEGLRKIPNKGRGFGVLKYNENIDLKQQKIDLCFNYLGDFSNRDIKNNNIISMSTLPMGESSSEEAYKINNITINGIVSDGNLTFDVLFNRGKYSENLVQNIMNHLVDAVKEVVLSCKNNKCEKTPSDFDLLDIEINEFEKI
ncbi:MAG: condensation domain-containing protein, partial [Clostridium sp.]